MVGHDILDARLEQQTMYNNRDREWEAGFVSWVVDVFDMSGMGLIAHDATRQTPTAAPHDIACTHPPLLYLTLSDEHITVANYLTCICPLLHPHKNALERPLP